MTPLNFQISDLIAVVAGTIALISLVVAYQALRINKTVVELALYKNLSDLNNKLIDIMIDVEKMDETQLKALKLFVIEIYNQYEIASYKYIMKDIQQNSFEELYGNQLIKLVEERDFFKLLTIPDTNFIWIQKAYKQIKSKYSTNSYSSKDFMTLCILMFSILIFLVFIGISTQ